MHTQTHPENGGFGKGKEAKAEQFYGPPRFGTRRSGPITDEAAMIELFSGLPEEVKAEFWPQVVSTIGSYLLNKGINYVLNGGMVD